MSDPADCWVVVSSGSWADIVSSTDGLMVVSSGSLIDVVVSYADGALVVQPTEVFLSSKPILFAVVSFVGGEILVSIINQYLVFFWGKIICC